MKLNATVNNLPVSSRKKILSVGYLNLNLWKSFEKSSSTSAWIHLQTRALLALLISEKSCNRKQHVPFRQTSIHARQMPGCERNICAKHWKKAKDTFLMRNKWEKEKKQLILLTAISDEGRQVLTWLYITWTDSEQYWGITPDSSYQSLRPRSVFSPTAEYFLILKNQVLQQLPEVPFRKK